MQSDATFFFLCFCTSLCQFESSLPPFTRHVAPSTSSSSSLTTHFPLTWCRLFLKHSFTLLYKIKTFVTALAECCCSFFCRDQNTFDQLLPSAGGNAAKLCLVLIGGVAPVSNAPSCLSSNVHYSVSFLVIL